MTYYGSFGNNNLYLAGNQNYSLSSPSSDFGVYGAMYRRCSCGCTVCDARGCNSKSNYSQLYAFGCVWGVPWYNTAQKSSCCNGFNTTVRNQDRSFTLNVARASSTQIATIRSITPKDSGNQNTNLWKSYYNTGLSNVNNQTSITCTAAYLYAFNSWRNGTTSGTVISSTQSPTFTFNSSYGGIPFLNIQTALCDATYTGSDRILKRNIKLVGKSTRGINIYTWNYKNPEKFGYGTYQGVMAQEVPYATVEHPDGYLMVDYSKTDVTFKKLYGNNMGFRKRS